MYSFRGEPERAESREQDVREEVVRLGQNLCWLMVLYQCHLLECVVVHVTSMSRMWVRGTRELLVLFV